MIKSTTRKVMAKFGFGCRFHDLQYSEVGFSFIFLEFNVNLRTTLQNFCRKTSI